MSLEGPRIRLAAQALCCPVEDPEDQGGKYSVPTPVLLWHVWNQSPRALTAWCRAVFPASRPLVFSLQNYPQSHCKRGAQVTCSSCHTLGYRVLLGKDKRIPVSGLGEWRWLLCTAMLRFTPNKDTSFGVFPFIRTASLLSGLIPNKTQFCRSE